MKRYYNYFIIFILILFFSSTANALDWVQDTGRTPFAYEKLSVTTASVVRPTATYRNSAGAVFITVESANIRWRIDGGNPDSNDGHLLIYSAYQNLFLIDVSSIKNLRMIGIGGTATVYITYYKRN